MPRDNFLPTTAASFVAAAAAGDVRGGRTAGKRNESGFANSLMETIQKLQKYDLKVCFRLTSITTRARCGAVIRTKDNSVIIIIMTSATAVGSGKFRLIYCTYCRRRRRARSEVASATDRYGV